MKEHLEGLFRAVPGLVLTRIAVGRDRERREIHTLTLYGRIDGQRFQASGRGENWADVFGQIEMHSAIQRAMLAKE